MLDGILARVRTQPSRTGSLIITLYGDAIASRGGTLALATLLEIFRALDVGDGVVRTAVSRLAAEGWLTRLHVGRHAFYRLHEHRLEETEKAARRIYGPLNPGRGRGVRIAILEPGQEEARQVLAAAGYGAVAPGVFIAPETAPAPPPDAVVLRGEAAAETLRRLAARAWKLDDIAVRYRAFLDTFPLSDPPEDDLAALLARMLLIHEWRRAVLRDPCLPAELLPPDWPGHPARARAATLYELLRPRSERWLDEHALSDTGTLPSAPLRRLRRFP
jgi:phenylacetic acid degradation operon negative regulatory protein